MTERNVLLLVAFTVMISSAVLCHLRIRWLDHACFTSSILATAVLLVMGFLYRPDLTLERGLRFVVSMAIPAWMLAFLLGMLPWKSWRPTQADRERTARP